MFTDKLLGQDISMQVRATFHFAHMGDSLPISFKQLFMYGKARDFSKCPKNIVTDLFPLAS